MDVVHIEAQCGAADVDAVYIEAQWVRLCVDPSGSRHMGREDGIPRWDDDFPLAVDLVVDQDPECSSAAT